MATTMPMAYEWLMPLAPWEPAERLRVALESLHQQTWQAQRLVISVDGQLSHQLAEVLRNIPLPLLVLESPSWRGTGPTLAAGLCACQCEWVLRADADDRSAPHRAERQLSFLLDFPHLAVLGAQLCESTSERRTALTRRVPLRPLQIKRMLSWRNPINHPTVALHRERVLTAGSYRGILSFEDWDLWLRLRYQGAKMANLPDVLVTAEVDHAHLARRHGLSYAKREVEFFLRCSREGMIPAWSVFLLMLARLPWRVLPRLGLASVMRCLRFLSQIKLDRWSKS